MTPRPDNSSAEVDLRRLRIRDARGRYRYVRWRWRLLFTVIDALGWMLFWPAWLARSLAVTRRRLPRSPRSMLVIQLDHLGDAVLSSGLLHWLKERYPAASLEVLTAKWNAELFRQLMPVDHVHVLDVTRFGRQGGLRWVRSLLQTAWRLRRRKYDLAIDVRGEFPHTLAMWLCGARRRIGWHAGGGGFLLTQSAAFVPQRHEVASRAALASLACGRAVSPAEVAPRLSVPRPRGTAALPQVPERAIGLHIGAGTTAKAWLQAGWVALVCELRRAYPQQSILLLGAQGECELARSILQAVQRDDDVLRLRRETANGDPRLAPVIDLTGQLTLVELARVLQTCAALVGADSGPAHMAAALGTPVVALFSGTNHVPQWRPFGEHVTVLKHDVACSPCHRERCPVPGHPCLSGITTHQVLAALADLLARDAAGELTPRTPTADFAELNSILPAESPLP